LGTKDIIESKSGSWGSCGLM